MLYCNVISHWLGAYTRWSLSYIASAHLRYGEVSFFRNLFKQDKPHENRHGLGADCNYTYGISHIHWMNLGSARNPALKGRGRVTLVAVLRIWHHIDGLVQDCSISLANVLEILQSCTSPNISSRQVTASLFNSSPPGQNGRHFADVFRYIFMIEKFCILIKISLKFVPKGPIDNNQASV